MRKAYKMQYVAYKAMHDIGRSDLPDNVKVFLFALLAFYDFEKQTAHPSIGRLAQYMGCTLRHARKARKESEACGVLECKHTKGGNKKTHTFRLHLDRLVPMTDEECEKRGYPLSQRDTEPDSSLRTANGEQSGPQHGTSCIRTRHRQHSNPEHYSGEQQREQPKEQPTTESAAVAFLRGLGLEDALLRHHNATPERLTWVASEALKKNSPAGWAAKCIREGWAVPSLATGQHTNGTQRAGGKAAAARERIAALKPEHRASLLMATRREYRNLAGEADDATNIIYAMAKMLDTGKWKHPEDG